MNADTLYKNTKFINVTSCPGLERSKSHIFPVALSPEFCSELQEQQLVCRKFLDFYICYCIRHESQGHGTGGMFLINNKMLEEWGINRRGMEALAMKNFRNDGYQLINVMDVLSPLVGDAAPLPDPLPLYALINRPMMYAAAGILNKEIFARFAEKMGADLFILPSSIHELLLIPGQGNVSTVELDLIVMAVNRTQVLSEERLADHVYYYSRETGEISIPE